MNYFSCFREHYRALIRIGVPIVIGQLGIVLVGLADNIMVGRYGTPDLAAASFVNSVFNLPILFGLGFSYGLTPLVGQLFGRRDPFKIGRLLRNSLLVNGCVGVLLTLLMGILYLYVDSMGQPEELLPLIRPYFLLQLASLIFLMLFNAFKQFADGKELIKVYKPNDWNDYDVIADGNLLTLMINGRIMCRVDDRHAVDSAKSGIIALQMHQGAPMKVEFKDIRIKLPQDKKP